MAEGHRERLRNRLMKEDIDEIPEYVVLEMMLTGVIQRRDTCEIARSLIKEFGSFSSVIDAPYEVLKKFPGMGEAAASHLKLLLKYYRKYRQSKWHEGRKNISIRNPAHIKDYIMDKFIGCDKEEFIVVCLDAQGRILHIDRMSKGSINAVSVSVPQVVNAAVLYNSASIIIAHNHVNGYALPSSQDCETTYALKEALEKVNIVLEDHIIVCDDEYISIFEFMESMRSRG